MSSQIMSKKTYEGNITNTYIFHFKKTKKERNKCITWILKYENIKKYK